MSLSQNIFDYEHIDGSKYRVGFIEVSPGKAEEWLGKSIVNRRVRPARFLAYGRDMLAGKWRLSGETIKFDQHGNLIDGQHRLRGIKWSNTTQLCLVIWGIAPEAFADIDSGLLRQFSDLLDRDYGVTNAKLTSAIVRLLLLTEECHHMQGYSNGTITREEMYAFWSAHPEELADACRMGKQVQEFVAPSLGGTLFFAFAGISRNHAEDYYAALREGSGLDAKHPIWILRERLREIQGKHKLAFNFLEYAALMIKTWNCLMENRLTITLHALRWRSKRVEHPDGRIGPLEPFPAIAGLPPKVLV